MSFFASIMGVVSSPTCRTKSAGNNNHCHPRPSDVRIVAFVSLDPTDMSPPSRASTPPPMDHASHTMASPAAGFEQQDHKLRPKCATRMSSKENAALVSRSPDEMLTTSPISPAIPLDRAPSSSPCPPSPTPYPSHQTTATFGGFSRHEQRVRALAKAHARQVRTRRDTPIALFSNGTQAKTSGEGVKAKPPPIQISEPNEVNEVQLPGRSKSMFQPRRRMMSRLSWLVRGSNRVVDGSSGDADREGRDPPARTPS